MDSRMVNGQKWVMLILLVALLPGMAFPQGFGKNKVQYEMFNWQYLQSEHFDIYYYEDGKNLAEYVADVAESSYVALKKDFRYEIQKRIPILLYNGHNDFEQTNVIPVLIDEGVGGFTEVFKDRVVVPFQGDYQDSRHVIHHELTHAVMFQMLYGAGVGSMVTGMARLQIPDWLAEGLAEYESLGWDIESDMYMRDATLNGYVPPVSMLYGWMAYKGGQSVLDYIVEKYGGPKVGELLGKVKINRSVEQGLKETIGLDTEELTKRWHTYLRKRYWPDIRDRDEPEDVAKRLTDHTKKNHFASYAPALSPRGDKLVYLSDQSDYLDIYLMSAIDGRDLGRLLKGERSGGFEELHRQLPGLSWSPDGQRIVFSAKAGAEDALYILDVKEARVVESYRFSLDGVFSPSWSPDGGQIAFMGIKAGQSDIYGFRLADEKLWKMTDDVFSDFAPAWSPNGQEVAFVSDRGRVVRSPADGFRMQDHPDDQYDLYIMDVETGVTTRYTSDEAKERTPVFSPEGDKVAYISDKNGITNIFILDRATGETYPITNLLTGVSQISWSRDGSRMAFASFYNGGYDIYLLSNPLEIEPGSVTFRKTAFVEKEEKKKKAALAEARQEAVSKERAALDYKNFVFGENFRRGEVRPSQRSKPVFLDTTQYKNAEGDYKTYKYKVRFSPDLVYGSAGYSQFFGVQGSSVIVLSDILGNHQINIYTDLFYNFENSNLQLAYFYLPKRTDLGVGIFHYSYLFYYTFDAYLRDRYYGLSLYASRPFNKYRRVDFGITGLAIDRDLIAIDWWGYTGDFLEEAGSLYKRRVLLFNLGYTTDTVLWGMTGPVNGGRSNLAVTVSPSVSKKYGLEFATIRGDWRKYLRIKRNYAFVIRMAGGVSVGKQRQRFLLGGMLNWINYEYREVPLELGGSDLLYFSTFETPLRGTRYYELIGTRFVLTNLEFRFPLIRYLILGWPLPIGFQNIRGAMFVDIGSAWDDDKAWRPFTSGSFFPKLNDLKAGYGFGARLNMGFILLRYDVAWATDFASTGKRPIHYFSLGAEF